MTALGDILPYEPPDKEQRKTTYLGMIIFLASWSMMFGVMFLTYGAMRVSSDEWPPMGLPLLPIALPSINTLIMAASSAVLELGLREIRHGRARRLAPAIFATALFGIAFCWLQWLVGADLIARGLTLDRGAYAAVFYGFAIIHVAHLIIGILAMLYLGVRAIFGAYTTPRHTSVRLWAAYWHFVGVVWLAIYVLIILL
jgi:cytochrome c oxidase subunit III